MTYLQFLMWALGPPIGLLAIVVWRRRTQIHLGSAVRAVVYLVAIAVMYTTPWDNYLIHRGVWWYGADRVLGVMGFVPYEEYGFMALQAVMTGLFTVWVYGSRFELRRVGRRVILGGQAVWLVVAVGGVAMLLSGVDSWLYLGLILTWAGPVLAGTWVLGGGRFLAGRWRYAVACGGPSVYLWLWDGFAIRDGIWTISDAATLGLAVGSLPIEEAIFFLLTNVLVVQGVLLFWNRD